jgi:hypothetical protein
MWGILISKDILGIGFLQILALGDIFKLQETDFG